MTKIDVEASELGRIRIFGHRNPEPAHRNEALWELHGYTPRVPAAAGAAAEDGTAGVHGVRTLVLRADSRLMWFTFTDSSTTRARFADPLLLDLFLKREDKQGGRFDIEFLGVKATARLTRDTRAEVSPLWEHPDSRTPGEDENDANIVPAYLLHAGSLQLDATTLPAGILPGLDVAAPVELMPDGIVFNASVPPPDGSAEIPTRVRLQYLGGEVRVEFVNPQPLQAQAAWRGVWTRLNDIAAATRVTAWARLAFAVDVDLPALIWRATRQGDTIGVKWNEFDLPEGVAQITLADQPLESQALAPLQVLQLTRRVTFTRTATRLTVSAPARKKPVKPQAVYTWNGTDETLDFKPVPLVHDAKGVRRRLFSIYAREESDAQTAVGFMMLDDGWAEIPVEADWVDPKTSAKRLPEVVRPGNAPDVRGSLWMGTRRQEFHGAGATPDGAAWSVQLDEPNDFSVSFTFKLPSGASGKKSAAILQNAEIALLDFAMTVRGMAWLAATAPDSHDALPSASDDPDAFFDVLLRRCVGRVDAAPFVLDPLRIAAPKRPAVGWDQGDQRGAPQPLAEVKLAVNLRVTAPGTVNQRAWLRHANLPSVQVLAATRSDPTSNRPHASRALTPFDAVAASLVLDDPLSMAPRLSAGTRAVFKAAAADWKDKDGKIVNVALVPLAALTLPGIELEPVAPGDYRAKGAYTMQLWDDPHARATLPPPDDAPELAPAPVVTALDAKALMRLMHDNINLRANAATQQSSMFPATAIGTHVEVEAQCLYPPLEWKAKVRIDDKLVVGAGKAVLFGTVFFDDGKWKWDASGDVLLQGPSGVLAIAGNQCSVRAAGGPAGPKLVGWSVEERVSGLKGVHFVRDGRGVSWMEELAVSSGLIARKVQGEDEPGGTFWLLSTDRPIAVGGLAGVTWELSFTDVPISMKTQAMTVPAGLAEKAGQAWTWSLSESRVSGEDLEIAPLSLGPCLRFVPTALKDLAWSGEGTSISKAVVEGTLVLGKDNRAVTGDTPRRVRITMSAADAGVLDITAVDTVDGKPITWDLDLESDDGIFSGAPQLSGTLKVKDGVLWIRSPSLLARVLTADFKIEFDDVEASAVKAESRNLPDLPILEVQVGKAVVNLETASLFMVEIKTLLRDDVSCVIRHTRDSTSATLNWFGNSIELDARIDAARRSCVLNRKEGVSPAVTIFPGRPAAAFKDGVVCLGFSPRAASGLLVQTHFLELVLEDAGLQVTHMLHSAASPRDRDTLRFDGTWTQKSLVLWPKPKNVDFDFAGDTQVVDFGTAQEVEHEASFVLSDHCIEGAQLQLAASQKGIRMSDAGASWASTWLVDTVHRFTAVGATRELRCLGTLQFWRPSALAAELEATWVKHGGLEGFGFVPGYIGKLPSGDHTSEFLRPGVRRVDQGHAGLFDQRIVDALRGSSGDKQKSDDTWIMLGGTTALCRDASETTSTDPTSPYLLLHLPFVAALGSGEALRPLLRVVGGGADATLRMSRHDILSQRIHADAARARSPGDLVKQPLRRTLPFACDLHTNASLGGEVLASNWFRGRTTPVVPGWHMEQLQRPGATPKSGSSPKPLPFPYPRAALMLAALLDSLEEGKLANRETLSILFGIGKREPDKADSAQAMNVEVQAVRLQPGLGTATPGRRQAALSGTLRSDLIVGGPQGVVAVPLAEADMTVEDDKHFIALAIASMAEPVFVVRRTAEEAGRYRYCRLPALDRDPLEFSVRSLRRSDNFAADGRLTWPAPAGVEKAKTDVRARARAPRQYAAPLAMAGVTGGIDTALPMGQPFTLDTASDVRKKTETVWTQEWEHVAYAFTPDQRDDAPPWMRDAAASARPLVPSVREIADALLRMDPALPTVRSIQTWLPHAAGTIDFASRAGAFVAMGLRGMRSVNIKHRQFEPADAGPSTVRTIRRPRPVALPVNGKDEQAWRRTVGWYALKDQTCLALAGAWDTVAAPLRETEGKPLASEVPLWSLFVGRPQPYGLVTESRGSAPAWRGSVLVQCVVFDHNASPLPMPAYLVLGMLQQAMDASNLRCGLRVGPRMIDFTQIALLEENGVKSPDKLVFSLGGGERITEGNCILECSFIPDVTLKERVEPVLVVKPALARKTLELVKLRTFALPVRGPVHDRYPLPILRRTVFFADPAFDRKLSRVDPVSVNQTFDSKVPEEVFNAWIDRPSVTPDETAVVRVKTNRPDLSDYSLTAKVTRREGGPPEDLLIQLEPGAEPVPSVPLTLKMFYALPTSSLRSRIKGALHPGDTLVLDVTCNNVTGRPAARLAIPVKVRSNLPPPQAMYSLVTADPSRSAAWCAAHSPMPAPENMCTEVLDSETDKLLRRGTFKWVAHSRATATPLAYSILKAEKATESTHIPSTLELEMKLSGLLEN